MKKYQPILLLLFVVAALVLAAFGSMTKSSNGNASIGITIGSIGFDGVLKMTADKAKLSDSFVEQFKMLKVDNMRLYKNDKKLIVLEVSGPLVEAGKHVKIARVLRDVNGEIIMMFSGCTQSCTSVAPCDGCSLNMSGDCSGSCACTAGFGGSCTHTVTSGGIK